MVRRENLEDLTPKERQVYRELKRWNSRVGDNFLVCIRKAKYWGRFSNLPTSSEAFSNVIQNEPCCTQLRNSLSSQEDFSSLSKLLTKAQTCIEHYRPQNND